MVTIEPRRCSTAASAQIANAMATASPVAIRSVFVLVRRPAAWVSGDEITLALLAHAYLEVTRHHAETGKKGARPA